MIETIVLNSLSQSLENIPVYMEVPEDKPTKYVILEKTGSNRENRIDQATFAVQSIAPTLYEAAALNEQCKTVMDYLPYATNEIFSSSLDSDYNFTDTETKERRYQAVYILTYKE